MDQLNCQVSPSPGYDGPMNRNAKDKEQHWHTVTSTVDLLADEYSDWFGRPVDRGLGQSVALGEYILELTDSNIPHDKWLMDARESFLKWKKEQNITTAPPANPKVGR